MLAARVRGYVECSPLPSLRQPRGASGHPQAHCRRGPMAALLVGARALSRFLRQCKPSVSANPNARWSPHPLLVQGPIPTIVRQQHETAAPPSLHNNTFAALGPPPLPSYRDRSRRCALPLPRPGLTRKVPRAKSLRRDTAGSETPVHPSAQQPDVVPLGSKASTCRDSHNMILTDRRPLCSMQGDPCSRYLTDPLGTAASRCLGHPPAQPPCP